VLAGSESRKQLDDIRSKVLDSRAEIIERSLSDNTSQLLQASLASTQVKFASGELIGSEFEKRSVISLVSSDYLLTTSTVNDPGFTLRWGLPPGVVAGVSMYSAALRNIFFVFGSKAIVRAPGCVLTAPASS